MPEAGMGSLGRSRFVRLQKGRWLIIPRFGNRLVPQLSRIMPRSLMDGTMRKEQEPVLWGR
jgi:hypothetical protein